MSRLRCPLIIKQRAPRPLAPEKQAPEKQAPEKQAPEPKQQELKQQEQLARPAQSTSPVKPVPVKQPVVIDLATAAAKTEAKAEATSQTAQAPTLTRAGYFTAPSMAALGRMTSCELAAVQGFVVSREGFGTVAWAGPVDLRGVDLDSAVAIESRSVELRGPFEARLASARTATLLGVRTTKNGGGTAEGAAAAVAAFERKVAAATAAMGARLVEYSAETGTWVFDIPGTAE